MPVFNLTVADSSPLIVYSNGIWQDSPHSDPLWDAYANGTFHTTQDNGATVTLIFNGSAVYVVGARRPGYGQYLATLDSHSTIGSAYDSTSPIFDAMIYSQTGLDDSQHQLVLTNLWGSSTSSGFDVSYVIITSGDANPQTSSTDVIMDDSALNISYSPGWDSSPNGFQSHYFMQTMHRTNVRGASASVLFYGNAITVYGVTSLNHGIFTISMDGVPIPAALNGSAPENLTRWQNMLYYSGGLSTTLHNMTIANIDPTELFFDLDKVVVSTWPSFDIISSGGPSSTDAIVATPSSSEAVNQNGSSSGTSVTGSSTSNTAISSPGLHTGTNRNRSGFIVAGVVLAAAIVALFVLGAFCIVRRRRRSIVTPFSVSERSSPVPPIQAVETVQISMASRETSNTAPPLNPEADNPHRDFPPPNYVEATASGSQQRLPSSGKPGHTLT